MPYLDSKSKYGPGNSPVLKLVQPFTYIYVRAKLNQLLIYLWYGLLEHDNTSDGITPQICHESSAGSGVLFHYSYG